MCLSNIHKAYALADRIDREEGALAYSRYREMIDLVAYEYGFPAPAVTGAFCALSPNNDYLGNLRSVCSLLHGLNHGWKESECTVTTYHHCRRKAWEILKGADPLSILQAPKTRNFYTNITEPENTHAVTIDGHMVSLWMGKRMRMDEANLTGKLYRIIAGDFREVAFSLFVTPAILQATLWFTWKRIHRVIYQPQLDLFYQGDQWRIGRNLADVTRFASKEFTRLT